MSDLLQFCLFTFASFALATIVSLLAKFIYVKVKQNKTSEEDLELSLSYRFLQIACRLVILISGLYIFRKSTYIQLGIGLGVIISSKIQMIRLYRKIGKRYSNQLLNKAEIEEE